MSTKIYVNSTWNSGEKVTIDGVEYTVGVDAFTNYDGAKAYALANDTSATIIIEKTTTVSGNCLDQSASSQNSELTNLTFIVKDGAVVGDAASKLNITYALTIEGGAVFQTARSATSGGVIHLQDTLTLAGDKENNKYAYVKLGNLGSYRGLDFAALYNGKVVATYADVTVRDLGCTGPMTFTDCKVAVQGALSAGVGIAGKLTLVNTDVNVLGHHNLSNTYFKAFNQLKYVTMTNSTITIDDGVDGTVADKVEFNSVTMTNSAIVVENGTAANVVGTLTLVGESTLTVGTLDIASNKKIVIDNTSTIFANALTGTGTIEINVVDKFSGFDQVIDLAAGANTTGLLDRITIKQDGYSAIIKDGDIYIASFIYVGKAPEGTLASDIYTNIADALAAADGRVVQISGRFIDVDQATMTAIENGNVKFAAGTILFLAEGVTTTLTNENLTIKEFGVKATLTDGVVDLASDNAIVIGNVGDSSADIQLTTGTATEGTAEVRGDVVGKDVIISNGKDLAVTGSVSGSNVEITNDEDAVLNGGSDDYSAKFTADEKISFVNDGHAVVDFNAKNIEVENNSKNTITNSTLEGEVIVIDAKENADGVISNSQITASNSVDIADQIVTGTAISTTVMNVFGNTDLGEGNEYNVSKFEFGSLTESVDAIMNVTNLKNGSIAVQNGTLTMVGQMGENTLLHPLLPGGMLGNPERGDMNSLSGTINIGDEDHTDAYVRIDQSQIGEDEAVNTHTLNVYGSLYVNSSIYNKGKGEFNIYGDVEINKYLQAAGITLVDGKDATLYVNKDSAFSGTSGIRIGGKYGFMSQFTIDNGAQVVVGDKVEVGFVSGSESRNGDLFIKNGGSLTVDNLSVNTGASVTINGGLLDVDTLTLLEGSSFTIDASKFTGGVYKALDLSMSKEDAAEVLSKINIINVGTGVNVIKQEDGDILFSKVDTAKIYVSSDWKDNEIGDDLGDGKYLGFNAFTNVNDAMLVAQEKGSATIILADIAGDSAVVTDNTAIWRTNGTYTFTGGNYYNFNSWIQTPKSSEDYKNVNVNIVFDNAKVVVGKFRLDTGSTLTINNTHMDGCSYAGDGRTWLTFYGNSQINITNSVVGYNTAYNTGNSSAIVAGDKETDYSNVKGMMTFYGSGVMTVTNSTLFGYSSPASGAVFGVTDKGLFTFTDSALYGGSIAIGINDNVTVGRDGEVATMILDNSKFNYINGDYQNPYACKITVGADKAGKLILKNNSEIDFTNAEAKEVLVNSNGEVEISGSTLSAHVINNKGTLKVTGAKDAEGNDLASTITAKVEGNAIVTTDNATLSNFNLTGTAAIAAQGNTNFIDNNTINYLWVSGTTKNGVATTTVAQDAVLTVKAVDGPYKVGIVYVGGTENTEYNTYFKDYSSAAGGKLDVQGTLNTNAIGVNNNGELVVSGSLTTLDNFNVGKDADSTAKAGKVTVTETGSVTSIFTNIAGQVDINGTWTVKGAPGENNFVGTFAVEKDGIVNLGGSLISNRGIAVALGGTLNITGGNLTFEKFEERDTAFTNVLTNNGTITMDSASTITAGSILVAENANLNVNGGTLAITNAIQNNGTVSFANTVNGNITILGSGSTVVANNAVFADSLNANIAINGTALLDADAKFTGEITSGALKIAGSGNTLQIVDSSNATLVAGQDTVLGTDDQLGDIAIKGENKQSTLTIDAAILNGNKISDVVLNISGISEVTNDVEINADFNLDILNTVTIANVEYQICSFLGKFYCNANDINYFFNKVDGGIDISSEIVSGSDSDVLVEDQASFSVTESVNLGNVAMEMKKGTTTVTVKKNVEFTIGAIQKDAQGGVNNVAVNDNAKLIVTDTIARLNNLTVGKNASVTVDSALIGTSNNQTIKLGDNSTGSFDDINLAGGKNTIALGKSATLNATNLINITSLTLAENATVIVDDNFEALEVNNTISLGKNAKLTVEGNILTQCGDNYQFDDNGELVVKYASNIGSTIKLSDNAQLITTNIVGLANLNVGNAANTTVIENIYGTTKNNTISVGKAATLNATNIDLFDGKDTLKTADSSNLNLGNLDSIETISLGKFTTANIENISGVNKLTVAAGGIVSKEEKVTTLIAKDITATSGNDSINVGKLNIVKLDNVDLLAGNDTIKIADKSSFEVANNIAFNEGKDSLIVGKNSTLKATSVSGAETITFGATSNIEITGAISDVNKLTIANEAIIKLGDVTFVNEKNSLTIGKNSFVDAGNITFGSKDDTVKIGNDSHVKAQDVIFGEGKGTLELGKNATLDVTGISGISNIKVGEGSVLVVNNGAADFSFDDNMKGNWSKLAINDVQGELVAGTMVGSVYQNEFDIFTYELTAGDILAIGDWSESTDIFISKWDETTQSWGAWSEDITNIEIGNVALDVAGKYAISVSVSESMFGKDAFEKENYSFVAKLA